MQRETSTAAVVSLIFGILAWTLLPVLGSIVAVVAGHLALGELNRQPDMEGRGLALAGTILGWIQIAMTVLAVLAFFVLLAFGISVAVLFG